MKDEKFPNLLNALRLNTFGDTHEQTRYISLDREG